MPVVINGDTGITQAGEFDSDSTFGFKNRIINPGMVIDQRYSGGASTGQGYLVDRWRTWFDPGTYSFQQVSDAPTGFTNSLRVTKTNTTQSTYAGIVQYIEGFNTSDLSFGTANAQTVTLSFWVKSSITGTFSVAFGNAAENRWYGATYTINSANTWEKKSVTVAGDTSGTWVGGTNGIGLQIWFNYGQAATAQAANTWTTSADARAPTGTTNLGTTNGATWQLTGVQLEKSSTATSFDFRSYGTELALCQRYYYQYTAATQFGQNGGNISNGYSTYFGFTIPFKVSMRTNPTILQNLSVSTDSVGTITYATNEENYTVNHGNMSGLYSYWSGTFKVSAEL